MPDFSENPTHDSETNDLDEAAESAVAAGPKAPPKGTSRLGLLSMLLGVGACVLCRKALFPPRPWLNPVLPAAAGLVLALLAFIGILIGSRTKLGVPMLGLLLCLAAMAIAARLDGVHDVDSGRSWARMQAAEIKRYVVPGSREAAPIDRNDSGQPAGPGHLGNPTGSNAPPVAGQSAPPGSVTAPPAGAGGTGSRGQGGRSNPDDGIGAGTIFDMKRGTGGPVRAPRPQEPASPSGSPGSPGATLLPPSPPAVHSPGADGSVGRAPGAGAGAGPHPSAATDPRVQAALRGLQSAEARVRAAEENVRSAYAHTAADRSDYQAAVAEVKSADELVADAKRRSDGFGAPLIEATNRRKEAQEKVSRLVNDAMASDPAVLAARRELADAEANLRAAYEAAGRGR